MLNPSHKVNRDLLTSMDYVRDNSLITQRQYSYDALGRPMTRETRYPNKAIHHADTFAYDKRSQLVGALLGEDAYTYAYDNIGNREIAQEVAEGITYAANDLNQYTRISTNGENFTPEYDADGNQTLIQTSTGTWKVQYNGQNRAIRFESEDGRTVIACGYDYMGRRFEKKVTSDGAVTLQERYIYRGYLQIAAYDLREGYAEHPDLRFIIWDPTQEVATRPLAIRENGVWYTYGWDLTKNICELYGQEGFIRTIYTYSPYGQVTAEGDVTQPIQWSSEMYDAELGLVYYNFRYYNPRDGRWTRRDPLGVTEIVNLYAMIINSPIAYNDILGLLYANCVIVDRQARNWGAVIKYKSSLARLLDLVPFLINKERFVTQRFCKFRCYYPDRDNCYNIPCPISRRCEKDHGVEVTVNIFSSSANHPAAPCENILNEVRKGQIDGGGRVTRNYPGY